MAGQKQIGWHKLVAGALFVVLFVAGSFVGFAPKAAAAGATYNWTNKTTISVTGFDGKTTKNAKSFNFACSGSTGGVDNNDYTCNGDVNTTGQCPPIIDIAKTAIGSGRVQSFTSNGGRCIQSGASVPIAIGNTNKGPGANDPITGGGTYSWDNATTISVTGFSDVLNSNGQGSFKFACAGTPVNGQPSTTEDTCTADNSTGKCGPTLVVDLTNNASGTLQEHGVSTATSTGCANSGQTFNVSIANGDTNGPAAPTDDSDQNDPDLNCDPQHKSRIDWLFCPLVNAINGGVNFLDESISSLLTVNATKTFDTSTATGKGYYNAWQTFQRFGLAFLVLAGLAMVISQALGFEVLDAYTIKKILPRLIFAIIGIAISWQLMKFFVILTNDLGNGIRAIIYYPFRNVPGSLNLGGGQAFVGSLLLTTAGYALTAVGLLSFALTAALAAGVAFLVLVVRQLVVIVLILFAPIAIACSILPNTQSVYKLWIDSFTKAMLMFPIIVSFIAIGRVFAVTSAGADIAHVAALNQLIAFAAYFAPYFLIPLTFSLAGGAMRTIGGKFNDTSRGGFDRLKKYRGGKMAETANKNKNFSRFSENSRVGRGLNTIGGVAANPGSLIHGRGGVAARRASRQGAYGMAAAKGSDVWQQHAQDDNFLIAMADQDLAKQKLGVAEKKVTGAQQTIDTTKEGSVEHTKALAARNSAQAEVNARKNGINNANQIPMGVRNTRAAKLTAAKALSQTGYQFETGEEGYKELDSMLKGIYGNDTEGKAGAMDELQYNLKSAGRYDLGGINHGAGYSFETGIDKSSGYTAGNAKTQTFVAGMQNYLKVNDKDADSKALGQQLLAVRQSGKVPTYDADLINWHGRLLDSEQGATGGNKKEIVRQRRAIESMVSSVNYGPTPGTEAELNAHTQLVSGIQDNIRRSRMQMDPAILNNQGGSGSGGAPGAH